MLTLKGHGSWPTDSMAEIQPVRFVGCRLSHSVAACFLLSFWTIGLPASHASSNYNVTNSYSLPKSYNESVSFGQFYPSHDARPAVFDAGVVGFHDVISAALSADNDSKEHDGKGRKFLFFGSAVSSAIVAALVVGSFVILTKSISRCHACGCKGDCHPTPPPVPPTTPPPRTPFTPPTPPPPDQPCDNGCCEQGCRHVPGPFPVLGVGAASLWSRKLRQRIARKSRDYVLN